MHRYSQHPFPPYQYTPGRNPHPTIDSAGHSYGLAEADVDFVVSDWQNSEDYRYGIDLLNHGYYWEAHEALEGIWHHLGRKNQHAQFIQALILLAVSCLHKRRGKMSACRKVAKKGLQRLDIAVDDYFGCSQTYVRACLSAVVDEASSEAVVLVLNFDAT